MIISYVCMKMVGIVHIWYCSSLAIFTYMEEYEDLHAQISIDT